MNIKNLYEKIPEFCLSHWLLRIPLAIVFLQQGLSKWPFSVEDAAALGTQLPCPPVGSPFL